MNERKKRRVKAMTWSDVTVLMGRIATACELEAKQQQRLAAMHRQLALDLRALLRGDLMGM